MTLQILTWFHAGITHVGYHVICDGCRVAAPTARTRRRAVEHANDAKYHSTRSGRYEITYWVCPVCLKEWRASERITDFLNRKHRAAREVRSGNR